MQKGQGTSYSKALNKAESNCFVTEKELLAVRYFIEYFRQYLFLVRSDHQSLVWLFRLKEPRGKVARWIEILGQYDSPFSIGPVENRLTAMLYRDAKILGTVTVPNRIQQRCLNVAPAGNVTSEHRTWSTRSFTKT